MTQRRSGGWLIRGLLALLATIGAALSVAVLPAAALAASPPSEVQTEPAQAIPGGAKLEGKLNPGGLPTTYYFEYIGNKAIECAEVENCWPQTAHIGPITGDSQQQVTPAEVTGLRMGETYRYRLAASNADGTVYGGLVNFMPGAPLPSIEGESVSHVTSTDATLEAQIDVESLQHGADYQFQIVENPSEYASGLICPSTRPQGPEICVGPQSPGVAPIGFVPGDEAGPLKSSPVSLDLGDAGITLKPGTTYHYRVIAARSKPSEDTIEWEGPTVYGADQTFTTPSAGTAPVIDSVSISHVTPIDATLEGQINSEGLSTMYEFRMTYTRCRECMSPTYNIPLPSGLMLGSFQDQSVSVDLNSVGVTLKPGFYEYSLIATSTGGSTEAYGGTFEPPPGVLDPPSPGASPLSDTGQPAVSNGGDQPAGSGGSPAPGVTPLGPQIVCLCNCARGCHGKKVGPNHLTQTQKLSKALKACERKPKSKRPSCKRQAEQKYP